MYSKSHNALAIAAHEGHIDVVETLIELRANVDIKNIAGNSPLLFASGRGHFTIVDHLIRVKADVNARNNEGYTPLGVAFLGGHANVANLLIAANASLRETHIGAYGAAIFSAAQEGNTQAIQMLLDAGARLDIRNNSGQALSTVAAQYGHMDVVRMLNKASSRPQKHCEIAKNNVSSDSALANKSLIRSLSSEAKALDIRNLLIRKASVNFVDDEGNTPLHIAATHNHVIGAALLLSAKAKIDVYNKNNLTPLMIAAMDAAGRHGPLVERLLGAKANVNARNEQGKTALMVAAYHGRHAIVKKLLAAKAHLNIVDKQRMTALSLAARNGSAGIVQQLLVSKADVNAVAGQDNCALAWAMRRGDEECVSLLQEADTGTVSP